MKDSLSDILGKYKDDEKFGGVVQEALRLLEGKQVIVRHSSTGGLTSVGTARMYRVRMSLERFNPECFVGLESSIQSLEADDIDLNLWVMEAENTLVSVWISSTDSRLIGIVIAKLSSPDGKAFEL
jgi:hypothetical protein